MQRRSGDVTFRQEGEGERWPDDVVVKKPALNNKGRERYGRLLTDNHSINWFEALVDPWKLQNGPWIRLSTISSKDETRLQTLSQEVCC
jgi:hypothetical protein